MRKTFLVLSALALSACADGYTPVFIGGDQGSNMPCTLTNDMGTWRLTTPGWVKVQKSKEPLTIACEKPGYVFRRALRGPDYVGEWTGPMVQASR